ncbi:hypothetical protein JMJ35_002811 [Cladonia borealis]|uniref:Uncharacterized protein n=1 Tax=Cladonia borealis TaxID=184061 RepID=A0AA39R5L4_9LECA|nr:hypothetical protein JMJ35_002811 [Cladonia borealis]
MTEEDKETRWPPVTQLPTVKPSDKEVINIANNRKPKDQAGMPLGIWQVKSTKIDVRLPVIWGFQNSPRVLQVAIIESSTFSKWIGSQRLEVVVENNELVLRPARQQSLAALAPGQTLAVSPYASGPAQPPPTPATTDAFAFAERMVERNERLFERTLSEMSDERSVMNAERGQYLNTINVMADRATSTSVEALSATSKPKQRVSA